METPKKKGETIIEVKDSKEFKGFGYWGEETVEEKRIPFFGSISKNRETTWVISVFVFVHIVAFFCTMIVNECWSRSHGDCSVIFFQPISENPLLGPSYSVLSRMGALRTHLIDHHQVWRLFTSIVLHAGALHLTISIGSVLFIGINLEQKFGPLRTGIIYVLSAVCGSLTATLFIGNSPQVCSSGALFGMIGASVSGLLRDWKLYTKKFQAVASLLLVFTINAALGLLPYVDNFSNIGGFVSGFLLGFVLFYSPHLRKPALHKGLFDYGGKKSMTIKEKLDRPVLRIASLVLFGLMVAGLIVAFLSSLNVNKNCSWCHYIDCLPSKKWICDIKTESCKSTESGGRTTLMCLRSDKYRILPYIGVSKERKEEMCNLMCS